MEGWMDGWMMIISFIEFKRREAKSIHFEKSAVTIIIIIISFHITSCKGIEQKFSQKSH